MSNLRLLSWNVNGIRAASKKGLVDAIRGLDCDVVLFQEVKADAYQIPEEFHHLGYSIYLNAARKKGYSGTMALSREKPKNVIMGMGDSLFDDEGRVITLEFEQYYLVNSYFPNSQRDLVRLDFKLRFNEEIQAYLNRLRNNKPIVICGDFNVAHTENDIARPDDNRNNAGFTDAERNWMTDFIQDGYIDTFRMFTEGNGHYSWWTYRFSARERNIGWRIDYFLVSEELRKRVVSSTILYQIEGSDHAPVSLEMQLDQ